MDLHRMLKQVLQGKLIVGVGLSIETVPGGTCSCKHDGKKGSKPGSRSSSGNKGRGRGGRSSSPGKGNRGKGRGTCSGPQSIGLCTAFPAADNNKGGARSGSPHGNRQPFCREYLQSTSKKGNISDNWHRRFAACTKCGNATEGHNAAIFLQALEALLQLIEKNKNDTMRVELYFWASSV